MFSSGKGRKSFKESNIKSAKINYCGTKLSLAQLVDARPTVLEVLRSPDWLHIFLCSFK